MTETDRRMDPPSTVRCRTLRMKYDPDENLPWAFIPGDAAGSVWLVATRGPGTPKTA